MTKAQAKQWFVDLYYPSKQALHQALKADWYAVQLHWSCFTDALCRNGDITQRQYDTWLFPWPKKSN